MRQDDLRRRVGDLYPLKNLENAHVVVVGLGALGSTVARALAATGVARFTIVDPDVIKPGNVMRHEARFPDVGRLKADAIEQVLRETNPYVDVTQIPWGTRGTNGDLERALQNPEHPPTVLRGMTANRAVEGQLEEIARSLTHPVPVLHASMQAQAQVLRAYVYIPGRTACSYCNQHHAGNQQETEDRAFLRVPDELES